MKNIRKILYISIIFNFILSIFCIMQYSNTSDLSKTVASIDDKYISNNDILEHLKNNSELRYSVVDEIIQQKLINLEADKLGLKITSEDIEKEKSYILNTDNLSDTEIETRVLAKKIMKENLKLTESKKNTYITSTYEVLNSNISHTEMMNLNKEDLKDTTNYKNLSSNEILKAGDILDGYLIEELELNKSYMYNSESTGKHCILFVDKIEETKSIDNTINENYLNEYVNLIINLKSKYNVNI